MIDIVTAPLTECGETTGGKTWQTWNPNLSLTSVELSNERWSERAVFTD